mmetsp:Transcript_12270/g.47665  ORF Transcript_12270/g.47665 Transcript_12270/m.47665 type:complete len:214 (-) Transcript_12270:375-1016(-)
MPCTRWLTRSLRPTRTATSTGGFLPAESITTTRMGTCLRLGSSPGRNISRIFSRVGAGAWFPLVAAGPAFSPNREYRLVLACRGSCWAIWYATFLLVSWSLKRTPKRASSNSASSRAAFIPSLVLTYTGSFMIPISRRPGSVAGSGMRSYSGGSRRRTPRSSTSCAIRAISSKRARSSAACRARAVGAAGGAGPGRAAGRAACAFVNWMRVRI